MLSIALTMGWFSARSFGADRDAQLKSSDELLMQKVSQRLGVPANASPQDMKNAYRKKAMELHPDRLIGHSAEEIKKAEAEFKDVQEAYLTYIVSGNENTLEQVFQDLESGDRSRVLHGLEFVTERNSEIAGLDRSERNFHHGVRLINAFDKIIEGLDPKPKTGSLVVRDGLEDYQIYEALIRSVMHAFYIWEVNPFTDRVEILWPNSHMANVDPFPASSYIESAVKAAIKRGWKLENICKTLEDNAASLPERFPVQILKTWVSVHHAQAGPEFDEAVQVLQKTWKHAPEPSALREILDGGNRSSENAQVSEKNPKNGFVQCFLRFFKPR